MLRTRTPILPTRGRRRVATAVAALLLPACVTMGPPAWPGGGGQTRPTPGGAGSAATWTVATREHVDLWLHGYALLTRDTARVPLFAPGYRERMLRLRRSRGVTTAFDANVERLEAGLRERPALVNGQFVPLYFAEWAELREAVDLFLQAEGDPRRASTERGARIVAFLASSFPSAVERDWLRLFVLALDDERDRFYAGHWADEQARRAPVAAAVQRSWREAQGRLERFLATTRHSGGDLVLALPLGGEGRAAGGRGTENVIAVGHPASAGAAEEAVYVLAHELVASLAREAVDDNTTPAQQRDGAADRLLGAALVRGGMLLVERAAPELADGYARYYLRLAGRGATASSAAAELARAFPLPDAITTSLDERVALALGGV